MELKAKVSNAEVKAKLWFLEWDRTKYRIITKRVGGALLVLFAFLLGYTLVTLMNESERVMKKLVLAETFSIVPVQEVAASKPARASQSQAAPKKRAASTPVYSAPQVISREATVVPPGTILRARLITGASDGPVRAKLLRSVVVRGEVLFEAGCALLGQGASNDERLLIQFDRLVKLDGTTIELQAQAIDPSDRMAGLKGNVVNTQMAKLGAGIGLNFVGGISEALQETEVKGGVAVKSHSMKNALLNGATRATLDQSKEIISSYKDKAPRIEVQKGKIILLMTE